MIRIAVIPHGAKVINVGQYPPEIASDPPMTMDGKLAALKLVPAIRALGAITAIFCSLMDRGCGMMTTLVKQLGIRRVVCLADLGQMGNLDSDGTVIAYPGHENDDEVTWQKQAEIALHEIGKEFMRFGTSINAAKGVVLIFSHRPILAGLVGLARNVHDQEGLKVILNDKSLAKNGYRLFDYDGSTLKLVE